MTLMGYFLPLKKMTKRSITTTAHQHKVDTTVQPMCIHLSRIIQNLTYESSGGQC